MNESGNGDLTYPEICTDLVKTLFEVGYVAVGRGLQSYAEDIFNALIAARPESELPIVGLAVCRMNFGDFTSATALLMQKALVINPASDIAKSFLGMISHCCGANKEALLIMNEVISSGKDPSAISLAQNVIKEINFKQ
ncbi:MAG: hypothetical protein LBF94_01330 [Puniceicoccales bacterium]|jgi:Flp pilus assembly protein TadD|nr:hypothetical protein [Puniceicoccales bacterium]